MVYNGRKEKAHSLRERTEIMLEIKKGSVLLFDGDSITDCGRDRSDAHSLSGYNKLIAEAGAKCGVESFNRGISGDRTKELLPRVAGELEELHPSVYSLLIGINDTWRRFDSDDPTPAEQFGKNLRAVLTAVRDSGTKIILLEPFLLPSDPEKAVMRADLDEKIDIVRGLAREFAEEYLPLDGLFAELTLKIPPEQLSADGVHPTPLGNEYIARWWLERVSFQK